MDQETKQEKKQDTKQDVKKITNQLAFVGILGNVFLAVFKLIAGIAGHSTAMLSDSIHTLSDVIATFIAYIGVVLSRKKADDKHPYGHERMECVASLILSFILFATGVEIGKKCITAIADGSYKQLAIPGMLAVIAALVSIITKEAMFWYTMRYAKLLKSSAFKADAWHHRSDALSSIGALIGIVGARHGFPVLDQVAGILICLMIMWVAIEIFRGAVDKMLDTSADKEVEIRIKDLVYNFSRDENLGVGVDLLRTRTFGERVYVEMEINADGNLTLQQSHDIAERVHDEIEKEFPEVKHVMIHVNPTGYKHHEEEKL